MTGTSQALNRHDLEAKIVKRCWEDDTFRKEFTADPAGAFSKYLGVSKSSLPKISVVQEVPGSWSIVLPAKPANAGELSEADLENVAGGITSLAVSVILTVATAVSATVSGGVSASATITIDEGW